MQTITHVCLKQWNMNGRTGETVKISAQDETGEVFIYKMNPADMNLTLSVNKVPDMSKLVGRTISDHKDTRNQNGTTKTVLLVLV